MKTLFSVILTLVLALTSIPVNAQSWGTDSHYLVLRQLADGRILPVSYQRVQMAAPLESLADKDLQQALQLSPLGDHEGYIASLQDAKGDTYYQNIARVPRLLRGEFASTRPEGGIDGYSIPLEETVFVVRVPVLAQTRLVLLDGSKTPLAEFDLDQLASEPSLRPADSARAYTVTPIQVTGSPANRLDMVILGDGYTAAEQSKFLSDTAWVTGGFFNISPLIEYMNYHNIYAIYAPSNQSGADHPLYSAGCTAGDPTCCGDPIMASDPQNGKMVDTIFDSTYCYYNIYRLLVAMDYSAIYTAAAAMPDWDEILLVVNDTTYGGSGGSIAVFSVNSNAVEIAKHEFGHSFGELADEYDYGNPSSCNDLDGNTNNDCASNVTNATSLA
ncbi:MAG TPA: M64 family metallopeptidase, partial [Anaerolineaceae bacterium]|nr:M64 family metallopeptidase [Anaerolineaceae bacterium]